jgi:hypothetical protein
MAIGMADIQFFPRSANSANHLLTKRDGLISRQTHQKKMFPPRGKSSHLSSSQRVYDSEFLFSSRAVCISRLFSIKGFKMSMDLDAPVPFAAPQETISAT